MRGVAYDAGARFDVGGGWMLCVVEEGPYISVFHERDETMDGGTEVRVVGLEGAREAMRGDDFVFIGPAGHGAEEAD